MLFETLLGITITQGNRKIYKAAKFCRKQIAKSFCQLLKIGTSMRGLTAMRRFGISIGPKEKKAYAKSNSIRDCRRRADSCHRSDAVRSIHRRERESHSAGRREANPDLRPRRSLPNGPRKI